MDHIDQLISEEYKRNPTVEDTELLKHSFNVPKRTYYVEIDLGNGTKKPIPLFTSK